MYECLPNSYISRGSREFPAHASRKIGYNDHIASGSYIVVDMKVSVRSMVSGKIHLWKISICGKNMFQGWFVPEGTRFRKIHVSGRTYFSVGTCFRTRVISRRKCFRKEHVSRRLILDHTPLGVFYLYMWSEGLSTKCAFRKDLGHEGFPENLYDRWAVHETLS